MNNEQTESDLGHKGAKSLSEALMINNALSVLCLRCETLEEWLSENAVTLIMNSKQYW